MNLPKIGSKVGEMIVLSIIRQGKRGISILIRCSCGSKVRVRLSHIEAGVKSCGCLRKNRTEVNRRISVARRKRSRQQGASVDFRSEHLAWTNMVHRCYNEYDPNYKDYGGRGIGVSNDWKDSFQRFLSDMGPKPGKEYTVERVNNSLGYCKENCVWDTRRSQSRNHRRNVNISFRGVTKCLTDWASDLCINAGSLRHRIRYWGLEAALTTPKDYASDHY